MGAGGGPLAHSLLAAVRAAVRTGSVQHYRSKVLQSGSAEAQILEHNTTYASILLNANFLVTNPQYTLS